MVMGASGDLARKKIYPTLWALFRDKLIPAVGSFQNFEKKNIFIQGQANTNVRLISCRIFFLQGTVIYGYARSKLTIEEIRSKCSKTVVAK